MRKNKKIPEYYFGSIKNKDGEFQNPANQIGRFRKNMYHCESSYSYLYKERYHIWYHICEFVVYKNLNAKI